MATKNMFEVLNTFEVPSMNFLIRKEVSELRNLQKTIKLKEIQFQHCNQWERDYSLQAMQLEKELGELYAEIMKKYKIMNNISE
jgi:hypothetical protein